MFLVFFRLYCTDKTGHKIPTQEKHPIGIHHSVRHIVFYEI